MSTKENVLVTLLMPRELKRDVASSARAAERSLSAEVRLRLRESLAAQPAKAQGAER